MSQAQNGDSVKIHYTGTLDDGTQFDSSEGQEPLEFQIGSGMVIPGFDSAVSGMSIGEKKSVRIPAEEAYGERDDELVHNVPRNALPDDMEVEVGMPLQAQSPDGQVVQMTVVEMDDSSIRVDANHPLAGQALTFAIELVSIN
ncbi:FKBP-type peptidyl-prolyl cis-trans isomerase [endosymbiont of Ridgeia piscesae]|jgi:peptidylprolyl isomerase|uniref:Peptidyl-prolyl cis-trans isomerase n=1 Tax=endosymbiont of Ridgeia piscesae TaxID=54398 RepID=A0A0T5Z5X5_9GAMM|nr:peptidylprolyl isomerase [endosymbiont of Ridgeia piscesae]KRT55611.1 FKBP-type peptidyl-prolyl cis-trans isomerase 2 [endosymbiont of Ridgeia piscesae]KRT58256.1 peptidylprolyl isomerase [endosymbiont of Ridgeia piscesae]